METPESVVPGAEPADTLAASEREERRFDGAPSDLLDNVNEDLLMEAFELVESGIPEDAAPAAATETQVETAPETETETEVEEQEEAPEASPKAKGSPQRVSLRSLPENEQVELAAAIDKVRRGEAPDIKTALGLTAATAADPNAPEAIEQEAPPAQTAPAVQEIKDQIKTLREQRAEAKRNFDPDKEIELTEKIEDAQMDLLRAEQSAKETAVANRSYQEQFEAACDAIETTYPDLADQQSVMSRILDDRITAAKARGDKALKNPGFIKAMADEVAADLGISKGTPTKAAPKPAPSKPSRPVGSTLAPGHQSAARMNGEEAMQQLQRASDEELDAVGALAFGETFGSAWD